MASAANSVRALLLTAADPTRAPAMAAYMKGVAPFLGVTSPDRRAATKGWVRTFDPGPAAEPLLAAARDLVIQPEREFAYVAIDLVRRHSRALPEDSLSDLRALALTRPWWDTVDAWAGVIGDAALRHRGSGGNQGWDDQVAAWATDELLWARRLALVFQVGRRNRTNLDLLFGICRANLEDRDFFMRKGIGWALRDAARTYPDQVGAFLIAHREQMSGLSWREATKHLPELR